MNVEKLMTQGVVACRADDMLNDAARIMWEHDCGFVPIVESDARPRVVGVVTDRDLCMAAYTRGRALWEIRIGDVMSTAVRSCRPTESLAAAEETMRESQVHRLPVLDEGDRLLGVISLADIAREAARGARSRRHGVTATEVGETLAAIRRPRAIAA